MASPDTIVGREESATCPLCGRDVVAQITRAKARGQCIDVTLRIVADCICPWWLRWFRRIQWRLLGTAEVKY
jgi:hypothetical protein